MNIESPRTAEWRYDVEQDRLAWSKDLCRLVDLGEGDSGMTLLEFGERIHPEDRNRFMNSIERAIEGRHKLDVEYRLVDAAGAEHRMLQLGAPTVIRKGRPTSLRGFMKEITDRGSAANTPSEFNERVRMLEKDVLTAQEHLQRYVYHVSHHLNAPLRSIVGFSELLMEEYSSGLDDQGKDYLGRVVAQARHLEDMLEDLLKLSRVMTHPVNWQRLDLSRIASEIARTKKRAEPGPVPEILIEEELTCKGDRDLMEMVLECLFDNAIKFSRTKPGANIEFKRRWADGEEQFLVRDNGVGFDIKYRSRLFQPFQRLHSTKEYLGNGVGLAIVAAVIQKHGGKVWAESVLGEGATFYFVVGRMPSPID